MYSVGRHPRTNLYTESADRRSGVQLISLTGSFLSGYFVYDYLPTVYSPMYQKVSREWKASHRLSITGLGVDQPIQTIGSKYAFIISPSLLLSINIISDYLPKVNLLGPTPLGRAAQ